jgi:hypothetical protein
MIKEGANMIQNPLWDTVAVTEKVLRPWGNGPCFIFMINPVCQIIIMKFRQLAEFNRVAWFPQLVKWSGIHRSPFIDAIIIINEKKKAMI